MITVIENRKKTRKMTFLEYLRAIRVQVKEWVLLEPSGRAIYQVACMLLDKAAENWEYNKNYCDGDCDWRKYGPLNRGSVVEHLLFGAKSWGQYVDDGCALCYYADVKKLLRLPEDANNDVAWQDYKFCHTRASWLIADAAVLLVDAVKVID